MIKNSFSQGTLFQDINNISCEEITRTMRFVYVAFVEDFMSPRFHEAIYP